MLHWKLIELECKEADFIVKKMKQINVHFLFYPDIKKPQGKEVSLFMYSLSQTYTRALFIKAGTADRNKCSDNIGCSNIQPFFMNSD